MKRIEKIQKQALRYVFDDFNATYTEFTRQSQQAADALHRLRRMLLFVEKCMDGKYPEYLNGLFVVNRGSNSRKLNMLVQPNLILNMDITLNDIRALTWCRTV